MTAVAPPLRRLVAACALAAAVLMTGCQQTPAVRGKIYVSNVLNNVVSVIDPGTAKVVKQIPVGALPHNFAFTPDYKHLVVTNSGSQNVSVIDTETDEVVNSILTAPIPDNAAHRRLKGIEGYNSCRSCHFDPRGAFPMGIATMPDSADMVITNFKGGNLVRLGTADWSLKEAIPMTYDLQPSPVNLIAHPTRDEVYVLNRDLKKVDGHLTVLDRKFKKKRSLDVIRAPFGMVLSLDGDELFIASRSTNQVQVWDTGTWKLLRTITTGNGPVGLHMAANGKLYTGNFYTNRPAYVSVVDPNTGRTLKQIEGAADITRMTTDPGGHYLFVANSGANKVQIIDLATDAVIAELPGGAFPVDIAFKPL
jgi:YVTN family beta-propeller protein